MSPARVLVVAFHFPPVAAAGTHRTLNFVRQLSALGHTIGVVTTATFDGLPVDPSLVDRVPPAVRVVRASHVDPFFLLHRMRRRGSSRGQNGVASSSDRSSFAHVLDYLSRCFDVPDRYASWILPAVLRGTMLARRIGAELVYTTAPPFSAHVVGLVLKSVLGLPWIADFRDPWATNPFKVQPYPSLRAIDETLEAAVVRDADRVILNTELCERGYRDRYPGHDGFRTITNGIDPALLDRAANGAGPLGGAPSADGGLPRLHLLHMGTIYGRRSPLGLLDALRRLQDSRPSLASRITIEQLGPVENEEALRSRAEQLGVADRLRFQPPVSHAEALDRAARATGLLLLGVSGSRPEVQVPAKLFEYLATGKPILALAKPGGAISATLAAAQATHVIADPDDPAAIARALEAAAEEWPLRREPSVHPGIDRYRYDRLAGLLAAEFHAVLGLESIATGSHGS